MGITLFKFPSNSDPDKWYDIVQGQDGKIYCTCWKWKRTRTCKHLENYLAGHYRDNELEASLKEKPFEAAVRSTIEELRRC